MPRYVVEREIPGAGKLTASELKVISQRSLYVLNELGPTIQWIQSYIAGDKIYCIYIAANPDILREHARRAGFPADRIAEIRTIIDPATGEVALTQREREVLCLIARGLTRSEIAQALFISENTVRHHLEHIYDKIGTSNRAGATLYAKEHGLLA